ncbi:site-specific integrase [Pseudomonas putida]|uniref:site-specific integrase n=1 Tax=Pseudomonas TaxID=286 RepID=UPI000D9488E2|nr:site-specific integrase [Pseudomonas sp. MB-090624]EKT4503490.1 site-specific integrase [Pseudomonas putida]MCE1061487.1 site-specific integrase [Pseudomonas alloputida]PYB97407.1 integrase [Pseudomonas sp. MB-090624]
MAAFDNPAHKGRIVVIPEVSEAFAELHVREKPSKAIEITINGVDETITVYRVDEVGLPDALSRSIYNFPFIFHKDGSPWVEANSFLLSLVQNKHARNRPTDEVRRKASRLLDYLIFCEDKSIDWLDFSGRRLPQRPTYKYHRHLLDNPNRGAAVANQYTSVIYQFYKFISEFWHDIDIDRVDTVKEISLYVEASHGFQKKITVEKRSQTRSVAPKAPTPAGFVNDEGEILRPLTNVELSHFLKIIEDDDWTAQERLIVLFALMTGARKQTVLTLRVKHVDSLLKGAVQPDGSYILKAGPGTGIDTKFGRPQTLYIPQQLVEDLLTYVRSPFAKKRRQRFQSEFALKYPGLKPIADEDMYVFLSEQCNCYYMAANDPRYIFSKSRPLGAVADTIKRKILRKVASDFPVDFTFHWLRATYAYQLYQLLKPRLANGTLEPGQEITIIQSRLHHKYREVTENYLKLFSMKSEKIRAQESYEDVLFKLSGYSDLILGNVDVG